MTTKYEFLAQLHAQLQPRGYLEIGVQTGASLAIAQCPSIGIDPAPLIGSQGDKRVYTMTSDDFWADAALTAFDNDFPPVDLVYIDGMHLFEFALRDFINVERVCHKGTVVVFDDVLPYNEAIAAREQPPGDWTGDVWKVVDIIGNLRFDLDHRLVDVWSTGAFVVWGFGQSPIDSIILQSHYEKIVKRWMDRPMPSWVLSREYAATPESVLEDLRNR